MVFQWERAQSQADEELVLPSTSFKLGPVQGNCFLLCVGPWKHHTPHLKRVVSSWSCSQCFPKVAWEGRRRPSRIAHTWCRQACGPVPCREVWLFELILFKSRRPSATSFCPSLSPWGNPSCSTQRQFDPQYRMVSQIAICPQVMTLRTAGQGPPIGIHGILVDALPRIHWGWTRETASYSFR